MDLNRRINLLYQLREYMASEDMAWVSVQEKAQRENGWFIQEFIQLSVHNIIKQFLQPKKLRQLISEYNIPDDIQLPKKVGLTMAGNIPLVGFHDFLCIYLSGHDAVIKTSSKDDTLIKHIVSKLTEWDAEIGEQIQFAAMLKGCDAYIATGSNNSSRYFEYYFGKYPHIIRKNRTSVAILSGNETMEQLELLADDVFLYFGLGCRNISKIYVPTAYDFIPLLQAFKKYNYLAEHNKYKNNYDYNLALHILNNKYYMSNEAILLIEDESVFSPISQLNYQFYTDPNKIEAELKANENIQCIVSTDNIPFGQAQCPGITDYADGVDTLKFLTKL
ncbi:MAG: acyl-CoA reductase [Bacteroidetes bacterium]|nr:acyl-CoA reductase [Bacteroidota bacterium]